MTISPRLQQAINKAAYAHEGQYRKVDRVPFIVHPYSVMIFASSMTDDEDVLIAALLHDVIEDASERYSPDEIRQDFGPRVLELVEAVTEHGQSWRERKEGYVAQLRKAPREAVIVSLADKMHNVSSMVQGLEELGGKEFWERFRGTGEGQLWFHEMMVQLVRERLGDAPLVQAYVRQVERLRELVNK